MRRGLLRAGLVVFWLATFAWLLRFEAYPDLFGETPAGYRQLLSRDVLLRDSWLRIAFQGRSVGFSHSTLELDEEDPAGRHLLRNRMHLRLPLPGGERKIYVDSLVKLNDQYDLQGFTFALAADEYRARVEGQRVSEQTFDLTVRLGDNEQRRTVDIPRDVVLYSPMTETAVRRLRPGQSLTLRTLDPISLSSVPLKIRALRREPFSVGEREYDATVLETEYMGNTLLSWVDASGDLLRQETPFGWTLEKAAMEEALDANPDMRQKGSRADADAEGKETPGP